MSFFDLFRIPTSTLQNDPNAGRSNLSDMGYNNQVRHGYKDPDTGFLTDKGVDRMTAVDHLRSQDHQDSMKE